MQPSPLPKSAAAAKFSAENHALFCGEFQARDQVLNAVFQLHHLVKDVQRHRGISMGLLAGTNAFEAEFRQLQQRVDRRLAMLEAFEAFAPGLLSQTARDTLSGGWHTIRQDWQDDKLTDNFELHSHFIEQIFQVASQMSRTLERPLVSQVNPVAEGAAEPGGDSSVHRQTRQIEMLNFVSTLLPAMIENLAKIRGLASFSAATGSVAAEHGRKLRFYSQSAREQNNRIRQCAQRLQTSLGVTFSARQVIDELEIKFQHLIDLVAHDVLSGRSIKTSSAQLFSLSTLLIDSYWRIVDSGMDVIRSWHRDDLEAWLSNSATG